MKNEHIPHLGFDMDGTIINTSNIFQFGCLEAFRTHRLDLDEDTFKELFGTGKRTSEWMKELGITDTQLISEVIRTRDDIVIAQLEADTLWIPGAPEMLEEVKRRQGRITVITNSNDRYIAAVRKCLADIDVLVDEIVGPETLNVAPKPDPRGIQYALQKNAVEPSLFLYVGDQFFDRCAAKNAGTEFCAYQDSHTHRELWKNQRYCVQSLIDLLEIRLKTEDDAMVA